MHIRLLHYTVSLLVFACLLEGHDYIYPTAAFRNKDDSINLYLMYQHEGKLALLLWNPLHKTTTRELLPAAVQPVYIQMLPDGSGFSFIDGGKVRIKKYARKFLQTLIFNERIYDISMISWLDASSAYIQAKKRNRNGIFHVSVNGEVCTISHSLVSDSMYPQKVGNLLFFIERSELEDGEFRYEIIQNDYFPDMAAYHRKHLVPQQIIDFNNRPIIFLQMISETEGFVIEHPPYIDEQQAIITFQYHYLYMTDSGWCYKPIFTFSIPTPLLIGNKPQRLYESLVPLLPRYYNGTIVYVDWYEQRLSAFEYQLSTAVCTRLSSISDNSFVPFYFESVYWYGGQIKKEENGG